MAATAITAISVRATTSMKPTANALSREIRTLVDEAVGDGAAVGNGGMDGLKSLAVHCCILAATAGPMATIENGSGNCRSAKGRGDGGAKSATGSGSSSRIITVLICIRRAGLCGRAVCASTLTTPETAAIGRRL